MELQRPMQVSENDRDDDDESISCFTGSYVNAHKDQQRRTQDFKAKHKTVLDDYKNFALNGGFGPTFGSAEHHTHREKVRDVCFFSSTLLVPVLA